MFYYSVNTSEFTEFKEAEKSQLKSREWEVNVKHWSGNMLIDLLKFPLKRGATEKFEIGFWLVLAKPFFADEYDFKRFIAKSTTLMQMFCPGTNFPCRIEAFEIRRYIGRTREDFVMVGCCSSRPNFVSIFDGGATLPTLPRSKQNLRRTPSAPLRGSAELFRGSHVRCDIPFFTEGIELVGFQRLGTIHIPRVRSGSDPSCSVGRRNGENLLTGRLYDGRNEDSSQSSSPLESPTNSPPRSSPLESAAEEDSPSSRRSPEPVSFEGLCRQSGGTGNSIWTHREPCCDVDDLSESDLKKIQPLLWLELAALFDRHHIILDKRKPFKRKKKEEGNVFGVSLNALVRRDQQTTGEDTSLVPLLLQGILKELVSRGAKEEGILRVAGNKQKVP